MHVIQQFFKWGWGLGLPPPQEKQVQNNNNSQTHVLSLILINMRKSDQDTFFTLHPPPFYHGIAPCQCAMTIN